jgi:hypothetical protein
MSGTRRICSVSAVALLATFLGAPPVWADVEPGAEDGGATVVADASAGPSVPAPWLAIVLLVAALAAGAVRSLVVRRRDAA